MNFKFKDKFLNIKYKMINDTYTVPVNHKNVLVDFFKEVIDDIHNEKLDFEQLKYATQFMSGYKGKEYIDEGIDDVYDKDMVKFIFLGWYIYTFLLKTKNMKLQQTIKI